jgi:hypothetical protein
LVSFCFPRFAPEAPEVAYTTFPIARPKKKMMRPTWRLRATMGARPRPEAAMKVQPSVFCSCPPTAQKMRSIALRFSFCPLPFPPALAFCFVFGCPAALKEKHPSVKKARARNCM